MQRDLVELASKEYDLVIVGGGISGACAAWDATLRGLSVALLERADFSHAASANCFKMIHGGIRYLQHADIVRVRESAAERSAFLRIAPHLSRPLPIFVPTYGHGIKGKEILATGMHAYDVLTLDRNRGIKDPERRIPGARTLSKRETQELYPFLDGKGLSGGAVFHDGQMYSTSRLTFAFLQSSVAKGAAIANHAEVVRIEQQDGAATGVRVRDVLSGAEYDVRGKAVLNATGGWAPHLLAGSVAKGLEPRPTFSRDAYFMVDRELPGPYALAVSGSTADPDAIFSRAARHLFLVPWRGKTLVGVWHVVFDPERDPATAEVTEEDLASWLAEINESCPWLALRRDEVSLTQCGLVLFGENQEGAKDLRYGHRSLLVDHERTEGVRGLVTLVGVRYTTARLEADRAIRMVCEKLGRKAEKSRTAWTPIHGGEFEVFAELEAGARRERAESVSDASLHALLSNHGSEYRRVLELAKDAPDLLEALPGSDTLRAEVVHAVRHEMAVRLEDVVFGRTDLGTAGDPGGAALEAAADLMASELGWDANRRAEELSRARAGFPKDAR